MPSTAPHEGRVLGLISNGLVQLYTDSYGKGPTQAKAYLMDNVVVCVLHETMTRMEHALVGSGEDASVRRMRQSFHDALEAQFRAVVEDATGRQVAAYLHQLDLEQDLAVDTFVLEPRGGSGTRSQPE